MRIGNYDYYIADKEGICLGFGIGFIVIGLTFLGIILYESFFRVNGSVDLNTKVVCSIFLGIGVLSFANYYRLSSRVLSK